MAVATKEKTQKQPVRAQLSVDFPRPGETIAHAHYTFRVSAPEDVQKVEAAVDQGEWRSCRRAAGYWWHDWSGYENGEHELAARLVTADGRTIDSEPREFLVQLEKTAA